MKIRYEESPKTDALPTFKVWLKSLPPDSPAPVKIVKKVWFPNEYPNFSLDTESYRLRIPSKGALAAELDAALKESIDAEEVLAIRVIDAKRASFEIETLEGEDGEWETLGETGFVCTVADKAPPEKSRATRKPVSPEK